MTCLIVVHLCPPFYPPFCFNSEINLLYAHAPARQCHVSSRAYSQSCSSLPKFKPLIDSLKHGVKVKLYI